MDAFTREDFEQIMSQEGDPMISIYMPTRKVGQETQENPIYLKNSIAKVEALLQQKGWGAGDIRDLLAPIVELVDNGNFWQYQGEGLAIFRSPDSSRTIRLPINVEDCAIVNNRFYTRPLLPMLQGNGRFYLLALSIDNVRLFDCDRRECTPVDMGEVPTSMQAALGDEDITQTLNFHTNAQPVQGGQRAAMFFGKGSSNESHKKEDILRFFTILEKGIYRLINKSNQPLVLSGVEYLLPIYREKNQYPHLIDEVLTGNPEDRRVEEMHAEAWSIVEPRMNQARMEALEGYHILKNDRKASTEIREILPAAFFGQVDILLLSVDEKIWGRFDPESQQVTVHKRKELEDEDLADLAVRYTLANNGLVYTYDLAELPDGAMIAATMRYPLQGLNYADDDDKNARKNTAL